MYMYTNLISKDCTVQLIVVLCPIIIMGHSTTTIIMHGFECQLEVQILVQMYCRQQYICNTIADLAYILQIHNYSLD